MKKLYFLIFIFLVSLSCDDILDTTKVQFTIPSNISKFYIAVFNGEINPNKLLITASYNPSERVTMDIPSGDKRIFFVVSLDLSGNPTQYKESPPVDLIAGRKTTISLNVTDPIATNLTTLMYYYPSWDTINGCDKYVLKESTSGTIEGPYVTVYEGLATSYPSGISGRYYKVSAYFSYFNINTKWTDPPVQNY